MRKKLLFVGFGKLSQKAAVDFDGLGYEITGIARSERNSPSVRFWRGTLRDPQIEDKLHNEHFDLVVITLTPDGRDAQAYRESYLNNVCFLRDIWGKSKPPSKVFLVSSTRVYGQSNNEWVSEASETCPSSEQGRILLETENALLSSSIDTTVIRYSGIYGPTRDYMLRQVIGGDRAGGHYTNRIHEDDCVGVLIHLSKRWQEGAPLEPLYLASDSEPAISADVKNWIANELGLEQQVSCDAMQAAGKRCDNRKLIDSGYRFLYPEFRSGYAHVIKASQSDALKNLPG